MKRSNDMAGLKVRLDFAPTIGSQEEIDQIVEEMRRFAESS